ncbi:MAG: ATP-binding protein [Chloroflexota bacterium]
MSINKLWVRMSLAVTVVIVLAAIAPLAAIIIFVAIRASFMVPSGVADGPIDYFESYWVLAFEDSLDLAVNLMFDETSSAVYTALGLTLSMGITAGIWVSRQFAKPISELAAGTHRLQQGDLGVQVTLSNKSDEVQALARDFNAMSADLARAEQLRRSLMADVSHELRTPLTVLEGKLRAALDHVSQLDDDTVANLYGQTTHLIKLVEDLNLLAKAESDRLTLLKTDVDIGALLREIAWNFELMAAEKEIDLCCNVAKGVVLHVDGARIRQVCSNLVSNALRHTPAGGTIQLSASLLHGEGPAEIVIRDSGEGIAAEHLPYLFDRFYRTDSSRTRDSGGSGLGLAIVKSLVEAHGGEIRAESDGLGKGTAFFVELPLVLTWINSE